MRGELRRWRYFLVVAEELHISRAAERLLIAQPSLSQQIRRLELDIGVVLFERTPRGLRLTPAGEVFAQEAALALAVVDRAVDHARAVGQGLRGTLRVGFIASAAAELTPVIVHTFRERFPDIHLKLRQFQLDDELAGLSRDLTDVAILNPPVDEDGLHITRLFAQPRVVSLPVTHPLTGRAAIDVQDVIDEPFVMAKGSAPGIWLDFWQGNAHRDGAPPRAGAEYTTLDEKFESVGLGLGIAFAPSASARYYGRPGVAYVHVPQLESSDVSLGWRADRHDERVEAFVTTALVVASTEAKSVLPPGQVLWSPGALELAPA
jgi:DNA-binding transcriptional LysR family regulator